MGAGLANGADTYADDAGAGGRRSRVVARVGPREIAVGELEDRIADLPPFQRASLGSTLSEVRHRILTEVVLRDSLLVVGAGSERLAEKPPAAYQIERARSAATIRAVRAQVGPATSIPMEDVRHFYDENRAHYDAPERYQVWRILCKTQEDARSVLEAAKREATPVAFGALAREHSLDKATNLRAGNLGFVTADGSSNEPGLRVDPAVVHAAQSVPDGALVPEPVAEGQYFSVVWRRGTIAPIKRTVDEVAAQIRDAIWKARVKEETDKLLARLHAERVRELDPSLLGAVQLPADSPAFGPRAPRVSD
jgi:peptidyl-prolyl cis-trans isomerase C